MGMRWIAKGVSSVGMALLALLAIGLFWLFQAVIYVGLFLAWMVAVRFVVTAANVTDATVATGVGVGGALVLTIVSVIGLERMATRFGYKGLFEPTPFF